MKCYRIEIREKCERKAGEEMYRVKGREKSTLIVRLSRRVEI